MIGSIEFFKVPGSLTSGDYPIFSSSTASLASYKTNTYSNCKFTKDFQQRITVPEFDAWTTVNMARLTSGAWTRWYWITDRHTSSITNSAIEFAIEFNAPTSMLTQSSTLNGYWTRAPTNISVYKGQSVMSGAMEIDSIQAFNNSIVTLTELGTYQLFWVSVTATYNPDLNKDALTIIGFPIAISQADDSAKLTESRIYTGLTTATLSSDAFPTLTDIINDASSIGLTVEQILDVSISVILPYEYKVTKDSISGAQVIRFNLKQDDTEYTATKLGTYCGYIPNNYYQNLIWDKQYVSIPEMISDCGSVGIINESGAIVQQIPTAWFGEDLSTYISVQCIVDYCQMYLKITFGEQIIQMPTTHIPYIGSAWDTYRAYSLAYDREAMEFSINNARESLNVQTNANVANGVIGAIGNVLSGDIGGAVSGLLGSGIQTTTAYRQQDIADKATRFDQDLTERRIQAQPASAYGTSYGLSYIWNCLKQIPGIVKSKPAGLTDEIYNDYVTRYGYSVEGKASLTVQTGFYRGQLVTSATNSGGEFDRLNEVFMNGLHITEV